MGKPMACRSPPIMVVAASGFPTRRTGGTKAGPSVPDPRPGVPTEVHRVRHGSRCVELGAPRDTPLPSPVRHRHRGAAMMARPGAPVAQIRQRWSALGSSAQAACISWCANRASHRQEPIDPGAPGTPLSHDARQVAGNARVRQNVCHAALHRGAPWHAAGSQGGPAQRVAFAWLARCRIATTKIVLSVASSSGWHDR
jgi:hypothetical protein